MKKTLKIKILIAAAIIISAFSTTVKVEAQDVVSAESRITKYGNWHTIKNYNYDMQKPRETQLQKSVAEIDIFTYNCSEDYEEQAKAYYNMLPGNAQEALEDEGWKIFIDSDYVNEYQVEHGCEDGYIVLGITFLNEKEIGVRAEYINEAFLHEIGHAIDREAGALCDGKFEVIYEKEKDNFDTWGSDSYAQYCTSTIKEYFAESVQQYFLAGEELKANCPGTYDYIDYIITTL